MTTPREAARAAVQNALTTAFPENDPRELADYGDSIVLLGEQHAIPIETLVFWIHDHPKGKDWSLGRWRERCEAYADARRALGTDEPPAAPGVSSASEGLLFPVSQSEGPGLCTQCFANELQRLDHGRLWCSRCGEVQQ